MAALPANNVTGSTAPMVAVQVSYSTADIEQAVFFGSERVPAAPATEEKSLGSGVLLVVNGELFVLDADTTPSWPALSENAGLVKIAAALHAE